MHAEITAMQQIVEALEPLNGPQRQAVARNLTASSDAEIAALEKALVALRDVKGGGARGRVVRWAMDAHRTPKTARKARKDDKPADKTIDLRAAG